MPTNNYDADARAFADALMRVMHRDDAAAERAHIAYASMKARAMLKNYRIIEYRCAARRCLLLDVINMPEPVGPMLYQPRYKNSPTLNAATSTESGRRANTEDGDHRWRSQARVGGIDSGQGTAVLSCDHVSQYVLVFAEVQRDLSEKKRSVLIGA